MFQGPPGVGLVLAYVFEEPKSIIQMRGKGGLGSSRDHHGSLFESAGTHALVTWNHQSYHSTIGGQAGYLVGMVR